MKSFLLKDTKRKCTAVSIYSLLKNMIIELSYPGSIKVDSYSSDAEYYEINSKHIVFENMMFLL